MKNKDDFPKLIFKYKALNTREDIVRFYDIIKNHRLYFPNAIELNDPFEGIICPRLPGIMGQAVCENLDIDHPSMDNIKEKCHILSFSDDCFSPQLWAYYCSDYQGAVLCFNTHKSLIDIKKVQYKNKEELLKENEQIDREALEHCNLEFFEQSFLESLLTKEIGWEYEREWRIVQKNEKARFLEYRNPELVAVIVGHKMSDEVNNFIVSTLPKGFPLFKTYPGIRTGRVHLLRHDYKDDGGGSVPSFIDSVDKLIKTIKKY